MLEEEPGLGWVENEVDEEDEGEEGSEGGKEGKEELLVDVANREVFESRLVCTVFRGPGKDLRHLLYQNECERERARGRWLA